MTAVLLLGDIPSLGVLANISAERVALTDATDTHSLFIDVVQQRLTDRGTVLVIYPAWRSRRTAQLVRIARGALTTDRITSVRLSLPPLALSLIADQLAYLAPYVPAGALVSLADRLSNEILSGAWVRSVTGLEHIDTPLKSHLASYLPGGFMVTAAPRPSVHRITSGHPVADIGAGPTAPVLLLTADGGGDTQWLQSRLVPALRPASVTPVQPQPLGPAFWGTNKYVEFVAFSGHPQALSYVVQATPCQPCTWCGEPIALPSCPFCGMLQPGALPPQTLAGATGPQPIQADDTGPRPGRSNVTGSQPGQLNTKGPQRVQPHATGPQPVRSGIIGPQPNQRSATERQSAKPHERTPQVPPTGPPPPHPGDVRVASTPGSNGSTPKPISHFGAPGAAAPERTFPGERASAAEGRGRPPPDGQPVHRQ